MEKFRFSILLLVFLGLSLWSSKSEAQGIEGEMRIMNGRYGYSLAEKFNSNGYRPFKILNGGVIQEYSAAHDLSRIRSAASDATAVARVPAVVSRTVPAARVASGILSKARYLKAGGLPGLVITTVAPIVIEKLLEDNGYRYDYDQKDFVDIWWLWINSKAISWMR